MSDKPFTTSGDQLLPFANKGRFSREQIAIKRRKKASKHIPEKQCIFQTEVHFDREFRNLLEMKSVRESIVSSSLTINTESISSYLSTMHERWRIQFQLQRLSGVMITPSIAVLLYKISLNPAEGTSSFSLTKPACKVEDTIAQGQWFCQKQLWWDLRLILWKSRVVVQNYWVPVQKPESLGLYVTTQLIKRQTSKHCFAVYWNKNTVCSFYYQAQQRLKEICTR